MNTMPPTLATAAFALADAAVTRERCKHLLMKLRESGNTCTRDYEELLAAYKTAKRRYRVCLKSYITEASLLIANKGM